jgi:hypothetical protein
VGPATPNRKCSLGRFPTQLFGEIIDQRANLGRWARPAGIRFVLPDYLVELYKGFGNNLPLTNNDPSWVLPISARYVIGTDGIIAYSEVNPDYTHRPDPSELLPVLDRLRTSKAA